jgi:hypothetical protein
MRRDADGFVDDDALDGHRSPGSSSEPAAAETLVGDAAPTPGNGDRAQPGSGGSDVGERVGAAVSGSSVPDTTRDSSPGTDKGDAPVAADRPAPPRHPGMDPIWQMEDETWPTLKLGLEHGWPPKPIADAVGTDAGPLADPNGAPHDPEPLAPEREHHDPRPAPQPPEDGSL